MAQPSSRADVENLLLELQMNRELQREDPAAFAEKVDLTWSMVRKKENNRTLGRPINAFIDVMGTHLPERRSAIRRLRVEVGQRVIYVREPSNPHDPNAVKIMLAQPRFLGLIGSGMSFLGYVPKDLAARMAPRMDRGIKFEGAVELVKYGMYDDEVDLGVRVKQL